MSLNIKKKKKPNQCFECDHWDGYADGITGWCAPRKGTSYAVHSCRKYKPREDKPEEPDRSMTLTEVHAWCDQNLTGFDCLHCGKCCVHPGCSGGERELILDFLYKHEIKPIDNGTETCPFRLDGLCLIYEVRPVMCRAIGYHVKEGTCKNEEGNPNINIKGKWGQLLRLYKACGGEFYLLDDILSK